MTFDNRVLVKNLRSLDVRDLVFFFVSHAVIIIITLAYTILQLVLLMITLKL